MKQRQGFQQIMLESLDICMAVKGKKKKERERERENLDTGITPFTKFTQSRSRI